MTNEEYVERASMDEQTRRDLEELRREVELLRHQNELHNRREAAIRQSLIDYGDELSRAAGHLKNGSLIANNLVAELDKIK